MNENEERVGVYARVSTLKDEQETSIVMQSNYYKELIEQNPNQVFVGLFADRESGKNTKDRAGFQQMLDQVRNGAIDRIMTKSIARFARNIIDTLNYVREFRERNVYISVRLREKGNGIHQQ